MKMQPPLLPHVCQRRRDLLLAGTVAGALFTFPPLAMAGKLLGVASEVYVNGKRSYRGATIRPGDVVKTGGLSEAVFVVGKDVFMLREHSEMHLLASEPGTTGIAAGVRVVTGGLLSAFASGERKLLTATATAAIRGTAAYVEVSPESTYLCTCYGTLELADSAGSATQQVSAIHHDAYTVHAEGRGGSVFESAQKRNHYDEELRLLETLAGRKPPFMAG
ncbi:MAG: hypothetical protein JSW48_05265 [Betaproteobacteria bacterium]|jgi:hypothetical protein|nr:MAG: hypothetical protein JSW48_05265 [Betaproteobacteria bacterium]